MVAGVAALLVVFGLSSAASLLNAQPAGAEPAVGTELDINPLDTWQVSGLGSATEIDWVSLVWAMEETRGRVYVGGRFLSVRRDAASPANAQSFLAAFDVNTGAWISGFRPRFNGAVYALDIAPNGNLVVGGEFTTVNGVTTGPLVELDPISGARRAGFDARLSYGTAKASVMDIVAQSDGIFVGGNFSQVTSNGSTATRGRLAKLDPVTGAPLSNWRPTADGERVMALHPSPDGSRLYVGGYFSAVSGNPGTRSMAILRTSDGGLVSGVTQGAPTDIPACCGIIPFDFATYGDRVYAATESHLLIVYRASDMRRLGFYHTDAGGGDYQALAVDGNRLWAGGHYWTSQSWDTASYSPDMTMGTYWTTVHRNSPTVKPQPWASAYNAATGAHIEGFVPDFSAINGIWAILPASNGTVWFGGDLTRSGNRAVGGFAVHRAVPTPTQGSNLAFRRNTAQSSTAGSLVSGRAVDGMLSGSSAGRSFEASTASQANPQWSVDLGAVRNIGTVRVWRPALSTINNLRGAFVFVSDTPFTSNNPTTTQNQAGVRTYRLNAMTRRGDVEINASGRYVRVQLAGSGQLVLDEVQVFAAAGGVASGPVAPAACSVSVVNGSIQLNWTRAANDSATAFVIHRSRNNGAYFWSARTAAGTTTWRDPNAASGSAYRYRVETLSGNSRSAARGCTPSPISLTTASSTPVAPSACSVAPDGGALRVNWTRAANDNATNFVVQRSRSGGTFFWAARTAASATSWTDQGVAANASYTYRVFTRSATSASTSRVCTGATTPGGLAVPTGLRIASVTRERAVVNYQTPAGAASVEIARNGTIIANDPDDWYTDIGLGAGRSYRYKVRSVASNGTRSAWSTEVVATTRN